MKCPKCGNKEGIQEYRLDVVNYKWNNSKECEEMVTDETLLPLSVSCLKCGYDGTTSEFGLDRKDLINPLQEDRDGKKYIEYLLQEAKVRIYPGEELLKDLETQLKV